MPWWIWLILSLFMLAMIVAGFPIGPGSSASL